MSRVSNLRMVWKEKMRSRVISEPPEQRRLASSEGKVRGKWILRRV